MLVEIFFNANNRDKNDRAALQNFLHFGFSDADNAHLLLRQKT
jgi:predicted secreted acid phosphatase